MSILAGGLQKVCWRTLVVILALLQGYPLAGQQGPPVSLSASAQKVKEQVSSIGMDGKLTVSSTDGTEYHGRLQSIDSQSFTLHEVDLKQAVTVSYADVDRVSRNYGGKGFEGKRVNPKTNLIAGIVTIGALVALILVVAHELGKS